MPKMLSDDDERDATMSDDYADSGDVARATMAVPAIRYVTIR